jgi:hypothetical protein
MKGIIYRVDVKLNTSRPVIIVRELTSSSPGKTLSCPFYR